MNIKITNNTLPPKKQENESFYQEKVRVKLRNALGGSNGFAVADTASTLRIQAHGSDVWDKVLAAFTLIAGKYIFWSSYTTQDIALKSYAGGTWQKVWESIENVDFNNINIEIS